MLNQINKSLSVDALLLGQKVNRAPAVLNLHNSLHQIILRLKTINEIFNGNTNATLRKALDNLSTPLMEAKEFLKQLIAKLKADRRTAATKDGKYNIQYCEELLKLVIGIETLAINMNNRI